jgi:hypothetical protein
MKYLKKFENYELTGYEGKLFINIPSSVYFKSDIKFQIIFVDTITGSHKHCDIKGQDVIQFNQRTNGTEDYNYMNSWEQFYSEEDFKKIKFMTVEEFYDEYNPSYIRILNDLLDEIEKIGQNKQISSRRYEKLNRLLERLTIPEVEHIINIRKFNI